MKQDIGVDLKLNRMSKPDWPSIINFASSYTDIFIVNFNKGSPWHID